MTRAPATAKINLALVVGPRSENGKHEVTTVLQRIDLADRVTLRSASRLAVTGFAGDTVVTSALTALAHVAGVEPRWSVRLTKRVPVAAGLGGGSSDAATALRLANATLDRPLPPDRLAEVAASVGADVPFFLRQGPCLAEGDGTRLTPLDLPQDYWVVLVFPRGAAKSSSAAVYQAFDRRAGETGYQERRGELLAGLGDVRRPRDLAGLPPNDLASSPLADELREAGALRADVSGAGPVVYALFHRLAAAEAAQRRFRRRGRTWLTVPAWYG